MSRIKVLFVCLGNICRSPLAEAVFLDKVKKKGFDGRIEADSCGTSNYHIGSQPDPRTLKNAMGNGITINHQGRQLCENDLEKFDYILAMDRSNYHNILRLPNSNKFSHKVKLMRAFDEQAPDTDVPDPYHGGESGFQDVFEILDRSMASFMEHLQKVHPDQLKA